MISVTELKVAYAPSGRAILNGLSVDFAPGRFCAVVGPNGCGKSTLLKAVMGFLPARSGEIELEGKPIHAMGRRAMARRIAYLPQENHCPDYITLGELVELGGYARFPVFGGPKAADHALFARALETVGLSGMEHERVSALSGGQRQRAWIAMVLAQDTDIILLDEPVNHLDLKFQYAALDMVKSLCLSHGKTVIAVLHDLNLATTFADDVVLLKDGRTMSAGPVRETITSEAIKAVFGLETDIFKRGERLVCVPRYAVSQREEPQDEAPTEVHA